MNRHQIRFAREIYNGDGKCIEAQIAYWINEMGKIRARGGSKEALRICLQNSRRLRMMKQDFLAFEALDKLFYASIEAYCKIPKEAESARKVVENAIRNTIKEKDGFIDNWAEVKGAHNRGHEWFKKQYRKR